MDIDLKNINISDIKDQITKLADKKTLIKKSDIIIVSTPHQQYKKLKINKSKIIVDVWGTFEKG